MIQVGDILCLRYFRKSLFNMVEIFIIRGGKELNIGFTREMQIQNDVIFDNFLKALIPFKMDKIDAEEGYKKYLLSEK